MKSTLILLAAAFHIASALSAEAQGPSWELKHGTNISQQQLSPSGHHLIYFHEKDGAELLECVTVKDGRILWSKNVVNPSEHGIMRFLDSTSILVGHDNRYDFVNVNDGSLLGSLPIAGESWDDLIFETTITGSLKNKRFDPSSFDPSSLDLSSFGSSDEASPFELLRPRIENGLGVFFFDEGMQIVDLYKRTIIYSSDCEPSKVRHKTWENLLLIDMRNSCDSMFFVDMKARKLLYAASKDESRINDRVFQSFVASDNELLIFNNEDIRSVDLKTARAGAVTEVEPGDVDAFIPVMSDDRGELYVLTGDDGTQSLYETKTGKLRWQTSIPGITDRMTILDDGGALLYVYDNEGGTTLHRVDMRTGAVTWRKFLFRQSGEYKPGHMREDSKPARLEDLTPDMLANLMSARDVSGGVVDIRSLLQSPADDGLGQRKTKTEGYVVELGRTADRLTLITAGRIHAAATASDRAPYDGEMLMTINLKDGSTIEEKKIDVLKNDDTRGFNAFQRLNVTRVGDVQMVVGVDAVHFRRGDKFHTEPFSGRSVSLLSATELHPGISVSAPGMRGNGAVIGVGSNDDEFDYWRFDLSTMPPTRYLIARIPSMNPTFLHHTPFPGLMVVTEEGISCHAPVAGEVGPGTFSDPLWRFSTDELNVGDMPEGPRMQMTPTWMMEGIWATGEGDVVVAGSEGIAFISRDGRCRASHEWSPELELDFSSSMELASRPVMEAGRGLVYSSGGETVILSNGCDPKPLAKKEIAQKDARVLVGDNNAVLVMDVREGTVTCHHLR